MFNWPCTPTHMNKFEIRPSAKSTTSLLFHIHMHTIALHNLGCSLHLFRGCASCGLLFCGLISQLSHVSDAYFVVTICSVVPLYGRLCWLLLTCLSAAASGSSVLFLLCPPCLETVAALQYPGTSTIRRRSSSWTSNSNQVLLACGFITSLKRLSPPNSGPWAQKAEIDHLGTVVFCWRTKRERETGKAEAELTQILCQGGPGVRIVRHAKEEPALRV